MRIRGVGGIIACAALAACAKDEAAQTDTSAANATPQKVGEAAGLNVPESVRYDSELDVFYVSNINGNPSQKDNNGFIVRIRADSTSVVTTLAEGGRNGVVLHAPKGMALQGDTLYVTDIDAVRMFDRRTGAPLGSIDLRARNAVFLNDAVATPDGIYITDTGIAFDAQGNVTHPGVDRVFRIAGRSVTEAVKGDSLGRPNGIAWDATNHRFIIVPFGANALMTWTPGQTAPTALVSGPGQFDGVEVLANGNILVSSWADSTVHVVHGGSHMMPLVKGVAAPADIGVDTKRNVLAIPLFNDGKVAFYSLP